jgi:2-hydroxy-6-oxonona-2,4-dienedioate hydrolase
MTGETSRTKHVWNVVKRIWRAVTIVVLASLVVSVPLFWRWTSLHNAELLQGSQVVSTAKGDIEVAIIGEGVPILQLHGSPGGYDQPLIRHTIGLDRSTGMKTISISRPGFLRTPLASGRTPEEQADLYGALMDALSFQRVIVQGSSGGSYSAIQFALRHPERATALILYAPDLGSHQGRRLIDTFTGSLMEDFGRWVVTTRLLFPIVGPFLVRDLDGHAREGARALIRTTIPARLRSAGRRNDVEQRRNPEIDRWPVEQIRVLTLIVHGTKDENSSYERSVQLAARIPGAKLVSIEGGDHLMAITRADEVSRAIDGFIATLPDSGR